MHHRLHDKGGSAARGSTSGVRSASGGFAYRRGFLYPRGLGRPPPRYMGYYGIRSTSVRYASYWNAFFCKTMVVIIYKTTKAKYFPKKYHCT